MTSYKDFLAFQKKIFFSKSDIPLLYRNTVNEVDDSIIHQHVFSVVDFVFHKKPLSIEKFERSTLHWVYKTIIGKKAYIIRISKLAGFASNNSLLLEEAVAKLTEEHGVHSPEITTVDLSHKVIPYAYQVSKYVEGELLYSVVQKKSYSSEIFYDFGKAIARVHSIKTSGYGQFNINFVKKKIFKGIYNTWSDYVMCNLENHLNYCKKNSIISSKEYNFLVTIFQKNRELLQKVPSVLLHGDVANHNVLCGGEHNVFLLDWEDTLAGDPVFDIAYYGTGVYKQQLWFDYFMKGYMSISKLQYNKEFWNRYWIYFLRISISKAVLRNNLKENNKSGAPQISERLFYGLRYFE